MNQKLTNCIYKLTIGCCLLNQCKCREYIENSEKQFTSPQTFNYKSRGNKPTDGRGVS